MKILLTTTLIVFNFFYVCGTILVRNEYIIGVATEPNTRCIMSLNEDLNKYLYPPISLANLLENIKEVVEISAIFNSYSAHNNALNCALTYDVNNTLESFFEEKSKDNSLYKCRVAYQDAYVTNKSEFIDLKIQRINESTSFERALLISSFHLSEASEQDKLKVYDFWMSLWENTKYPCDYYFLALLNPLSKQYIDKMSNVPKNKYGESIFEYTGNSVSYFSLVYIVVMKNSNMINGNFLHSVRVEKEISFDKTIEKSFDNFNSWYKKVYNELIKTQQLLDADFTFFWFRNVYNNLAVDLARKHIQNPDFKDARYKTVYYLVNHDFDYSFPILTKMVQDGSLHINEKKNFYRGLANLNKLPYSVLTKEQQQKANDYLKQQMHSEQDISIKLYIDFLLSICVDEYGLSNERTSFLNSLKETTSISQEDIAQIDRRLKIIKYSIYTHSPSIFDSYVNGLTTEKPFIDVSKVDIHMLPVYEAEANGETWYYHDVNSEAYIATNTNKYKSLNLTIPQKLGIFPVVGITEGAFGSSWHSYTNIVIPKSVTYISYQAFAYNTNLLSIAIPNTVTNIGYSAFKRSNNISTIFLEEGSIFEDKHLYNDRDLTPNCKIIRTKFENGLPVIPLDEKNNE